MSQFDSSKRLCCWAGLTPGNNESAGKKKSVRITCAGVYIKPALVQVTHAAVKSTDNLYYRLKYKKISKRRGKKRAIIAIARMILTAIFQMMTTGEVWNPSDLFKVDMPNSLENGNCPKPLIKLQSFLKSIHLDAADISFTLIPPLDFGLVYKNVSVAFSFIIPHTPRKNNPLKGSDTMFFTLILENFDGEQLNLTTTAHQYMVSKIDGLYPPNGTNL